MIFIKLSIFQVKHERLFLVSVLGFLVNLVGIYAFQHGHSHGGGSHGHSHGGGSAPHSIHKKEDTNLLLSNFHNDGGHNHSHNGGGGAHHGHAHDHNAHGKKNFIKFIIHNLIKKTNYILGHTHSLESGQSQIMKGVFLHILADTLGSVGVIISSVLMYYFGWMIADPICSMFIAIMIALSVLGLIKESIMILMQRQPEALDHRLLQCYQKVTGLAGVYSVQEPHFWTLCSDVYVGAIKLEVSKNVDPKYVVTQTRSIFEEVGVRQIYVQLDYAAMW